MKLSDNWEKSTIRWVTAACAVINTLVMVMLGGIIAGVFATNPLSGGLMLASFCGARALLWLYAVDRKMEDGEL